MILLHSGAETLTITLLFPLTPKRRFWQDLILGSLDLTPHLTPERNLSLSITSSSDPREISLRYLSATSRRASAGHSLNQSMVVQFTNAGYIRIRFLERSKVDIIAVKLRYYFPRYRSQKIQCLVSKIQAASNISRNADTIINFIEKGIPCGFFF